MGEGEGSGRRWGGHSQGRRMNRAGMRTRRHLAVVGDEEVGPGAPCGECGATPSETVTIEVEDGKLEKDLCALHLSELLRGARVLGHYVRLVTKMRPTDPPERQ